jgi:hypothetical protein
MMHRRRFKLPADMPLAGDETRSAASPARFPVGSDLKRARMRTRVRSCAPAHDVRGARTIFMRRVFVWEILEFFTRIKFSRARPAHGSIERGARTIVRGVQILD